LPGKIHVEGEKARAIRDVLNLDEEDNEISAREIAAVERLDDLARPSSVHAAYAGCVVVGGWRGRDKVDVDVRAAQLDGAWRRRS
jgi:hypothetical protein